MLQNSHNISYKKILLGNKVTFLETQEDPQLLLYRELILL